LGFGTLRLTAVKPLLNGIWTYRVSKPFVILHAPRLAGLARPQTGACWAKRAGPEGAALGSPFSLDAPMLEGVPDGGSVRASAGEALAGQVWLGARPIRASTRPQAHSSSMP